MKTYVNEMKKCIQLAKTAFGKVSPNPLVGCIILDENNNIVSEGFHSEVGNNHAERDALLKKGDFKDCTLIVNLEPCCHYGKTPPCTDLIIEKGIKRVVYGMKDPNPRVSGKGLLQLKNSGIEIIGPILEDECKELNEIFIKNQIEKKTFVALKTATTIDGKISTHNGNSKWITSETARNNVKSIRNIYDAILTSSSTVIADNPTMLAKKKIILDRELKTDINYKIYQQGEIYVFYDEILTPPNIENERIKFIKTPCTNSKLDIEFVLKKLFELGIMSVLIEAGGKLNGSFLPYVDKIYHFIAPKILNDNSGKSCFDGIKADRISDCSQFVIANTEFYPPDILVVYKR